MNGFEVHDMSISLDRSLLKTAVGDAIVKLTRPGLTRLSDQEHVAVLRGLSEYIGEAGVEDIFDVFVPRSLGEIDETWKAGAVRLLTRFLDDL